jgi:hypothetical protein
MLLFAGWKGHRKHLAWENQSKAVWEAALGGAFLATACSPGESSRMIRSTPQRFRKLFVILIAFLLAAGTLSAQDAAPQAPGYTPKFKGDPARSDSEAAALAYMRVVIRAQHQFSKQYDHYATSLAELVHSGSFTKRMVNTDRGDYTASFKGKKDSYVLTMTPRSLDAQHRSFYAEDDGKIHADESKPADADSPVVK